MKKAVLIIFLAFMAGLPLYGQVPWAIWMDYNPSIRLSEKTLFYGIADLRFQNLNTNLRTLRVGGSLRYDITPKIELHGGTHFFYDNFGITVAESFEWRPYQGVRFRWPSFKKIQFKHFFRVEERFVWAKDENWAFDFGVRLRYRLGFTIPAWRKAKRQELYFPISYELTHLFGQETSSRRLFSKDRLLVGMAFRISNRFTAEVHYFLNSKGLGGVTEFDPTTQGMRFRLRHRIRNRKVLEQ